MVKWWIIKLMKRKNYLQWLSIDKNSTIIIILY